jgi:hypothetical protein
LSAAEAGALKEQLADVVKVGDGHLHACLPPVGLHAC